ISFIGVALGRQMIHSNYEFPFLNCEEALCKGEFSRNFVEWKMALGAKGWIGVAHYKVDTLRAPHGRLPMADWRNIIIGNPKRDIQIEKKLIFGKNNGKHLYGVLLEN